MTSVHRRRPLRGRDEQMAAAAEILHAALVDGRAGTIVVRGPAGCGKSRLMSSIVGAAGDLRFDVLAGSGDMDATSMPLAPLLQAVLGGAPPLMDRLSVQELLSNDDARYVIIEEIIESLERVARRQPLLIAIDDIQFSDPTTLFALRVMAERLSAEPVVWMVGVREPVHDEGIVRTIDRLESLNTAILSLPRLAQHTLAQIAEDFLGATLDDNLRTIVAQTDGQVIDLVEILRGLIDERRIDIVGGRATLDDMSAPTRLRESVNRRMAGLPPEAADFVAAAAVVRPDVTARVVAAMLGRPIEEATAALGAAEQAQLVVNVDGRYAFRHDLVRAAVEMTLEPDRRRELRRTAVDARLDEGAPVLEVATALSVSANRGDAQAAGLLEHAAEKASTTNPSTGADLVGRAAELVVDDPARRGRLLARQVMLLWQAGRGIEAQRIGEQALMGGLSATDEAEVRLGLAQVTAEHSYQEAGRHAALALALPGLTAGTRAKLFAAQCVTKITLNDFVDLETDLAAGLGYARASHDHVSEASLLATQSTLSFQQMDWALAITQAAQGMRVAEHVTAETTMWSPKAIWQAILLSATGSPSDALRLTDDGIAEANAGRQGAALSLWMMIRSRVLLESGRLSDAQAEAETVLTMSDWRERSTMADYTVNFVLRRVAQYTGEPGALARTRSGAAQMARDPVRNVRRQGKWLATLDADYDGHPDLAVELAAEGVAEYGQLGNAFSLDPADEPLFARIAARAGRPDLADRAARYTETRASRNPGFPILQAIARHTRGLIDDDPELLGEAAASFADTDRPLPRAAALEDAGRSSQHRDTAIALLDQAHQLYSTAGALRDAARTRQRLRTLGVRRRQPSNTVTQQLATLTPSEMAVVDLVARGATNREVATQLFLSPHTVNTHLRHAFTKIGVRSRVELARLRVLSEQGEPET
ncbi:LuxR C-terminal-related transcriptional regulator [Mycolicibacterium hodleri]|uniref:LuxR family transcriptional regulator n=1 Tax=Mycolicibacterium hodleri TaxID=49897 RepID=A0A502EBL8_9MYCO|nr:LuxR family transcriptional regulator [Mycolicibacterium hodleri]TPG35063.1 LuxR family transcriptional regulator [Mycolicibacterium hodleri]